MLFLKKVVQDLEYGPVFYCGRAGIRRSKKSARWFFLFSEGEERLSVSGHDFSRAERFWKSRRGFSP